MRVTIERDSHYIFVNGVSTELKRGEHDLQDEVAKSMIDNGFAKEVKIEVKKKKNKASE